MQTEPPKAEPPKRKRRWFQFSLRSLMIFMLIVAIPCAWLGRKIERKRGFFKRFRGRSKKLTCGKSAA